MTKSSITYTLDRDGKTQWVVSQDWMMFSLTWHDRHGHGSELLRDKSRSKLVAIAIQLEAVNPGDLWRAYEAGKFRTTATAEAWLKAYEARSSAAK